MYYVSCIVLFQDLKFSSFAISPAQQVLTSAVLLLLIVYTSN